MADNMADKPMNWWRALRPLFWVMLLVLTFCVIRRHHELSSHTHLAFQVMLAGQRVNDAAAMLDGKHIVSGQWIAIGSHRFTVTHPKGDTFTTNLFFNWYGIHDLGVIQLSRSHGNLNLTANPPADILTVTGPQFSTTLYNNSGTNITVPADAYQIEIIYPHWRKKVEVAAVANQATPINFAPQFGALQLDCHQQDVTYQLQSMDGQVATQGTLPLLTTQLPTGGYQLTTTHHGHQRRETVIVNLNVTNDVNCDFQYGVAHLESSPSGATVRINNDREMGETPLTINELLPGTWNFTMQKSGYQSVRLSLAVIANETNYVSTNLLSETYLNAVSQAHQWLTAKNFNQALLSANDALAAEPGDDTATALRRQAIGQLCLQHAKALAQTNDYIAAGRELIVAKANLPDDTEIKTLLAAYMQQKPAQIERERIERLGRPQRVFHEVLERIADANLFEEHTLTTSKKFDDAGAAIAQALKSGRPAFQITGTSSTRPEIYEIEAFYEIPGLLGEGTTSGRRWCVIVCGQAKDDETQIWFKVLEYKAETTVPYSIGSLLHSATPNKASYTPIHPSRIPDMTDKLKAQIQSGLSNLTTRIQEAISQ